MTFGLWAELMDDAAVSAALPSLGRRGLGLGLALPSHRLGDPSFAELTRRAADAGVRVRAWPLLPRELGYWIGEENAAEACELVGELVRWSRRRGGPVLEGVSIDLEPAYEYSELLRHAGPARLLGALAAHVVPARFAAARTQLARAVDTLRDAGLVAHAVTFPLVLDQAEGDTTLEDALDIPVSGIDWDEVSFMVYQTPFAQLVGSWLGPALVHSYAKSAVTRFGARAGLDLGVVGAHGVGIDAGERYPDPSVLASDLAAANSAGVPLDRLRVYGLAGVLDDGGVERWLATSDVTAVAPEPSRLVDGLRNTVRALGVALRAPLGRRPSPRTT